MWVISRAHVGQQKNEDDDGQRLTAAAGAELEHVDQANIHPAMPKRCEGKPHDTPFIFPGGAPRDRRRQKCQTLRQRI